MDDSPHQNLKPYHRMVTIALVLLNLAVVLYAIYDGGAGDRSFHFREDSFITWLASAQMLGASLLFIACYLAVNILKVERHRKEGFTWLVFAIGFLLLALDQQFRLRDQITLLVEGSVPRVGSSSPTAMALKAVAAGGGVVLLVMFRETVLANFRMVVAFIAGFWFLLSMLLVDLMVEGITGQGGVTKILEGSSKLLAMAMFLSASYAALIERLQEARAAQEQLEQRRREPHRYRGTGPRTPVALNRTDEQPGSAQGAQVLAAQDAPAAQQSPPGPARTGEDGSGGEGTPPTAAGTPATR